MNYQRDHLMEVKEENELQRNEIRSWHDGSGSRGFCTECRDRNAFHSAFQSRGILIVPSSSETTTL
jgi:hypothetical protein